MIFHYTLDLDVIGEKYEIKSQRRAARGIIIEEEKILLVKSKGGDYKLPGGGIKEAEPPLVALVREIREETGYLTQNVMAKLGVIWEKRKDIFQENAAFLMISSYYLCELNPVKFPLDLDDYEKEHEFQPVWLDLDEAILANEQVLRRPKTERNRWVPREILALKALRDNYEKLKI